MLSRVLRSDEVQKLTLTDVYELAKKYKDTLKNQAAQYGRNVKIYLHWSAGRYHQFWSDYHIQIDYDGTIYMPKDLTLSTTVAATWKRNTGSINVAILGCLNATSGNLGDLPPTQRQVESMAQVICMLCDGLGIENIDKNYVLTHGEAAANEDGLHPHPAYAPWNDECKDGDVRWDLEYLGYGESKFYNPYNRPRGMRGGDVLRGKAIWYRNFGKLHKGDK